MASRHSLKHFQTHIHFRRTCSKGTVQELLGRSDVTVATLATVPLLRDQIQPPI